MSIESPKVVDLSRPGGSVAVEVDASEAAEVLMSLSCIGGGDDYDTFDLGKERLAAIRSSLDPDLLSAVEELTLGTEKLPAYLLGLVSELPKPRTFDAFLDRLAVTEPLDIQLYLLGYHMRGHHVTSPHTILAAAKGDADARAEVLAAIAEWPGAKQVAANLFELGADELKRRLLEVLPSWYEQAFLPLADEAMPAIERDALEKQKLARTRSPEQLVELSANGLQYTPGPEVRKLVFFPSYWMRPWLMLIDHKHARIFCHPAAEPAEADAGPPLAQLARVYKALGDEGRLRLIKRLEGGPMTLGDAAAELGVAKSTAHHHLAILRAAGFVLVRDGDEKVYSLRHDVIPQAGALLDAHLRPGR